MFLGKKGESMPASANSAMHGAYSAQCIFGMLLDSVCGSRRMGFLSKRWYFLLFRKKPAKGRGLVTTHQLVLIIACRHTQV